MWAYPNTAQFFWVPPIISGTGKATDFKFGRYIYRFNLNKSLLKIFQKSERGRIQGLSKFFGYPLLPQERIKLRTSNLVGKFRGSIRTKARENVGNSSRGRSQGVPKIFRAPMCRAHCAVIFAIAQLFCIILGFRVVRGSESLIRTPLSRAGLSVCRRHRLIRRATV